MSSIDNLEAEDELSYLSDQESEAATQELLAIPGLLELIKQSQLIPKNNYINWRTLRLEED